MPAPIRPIRFLGAGGRADREHLLPGPYISPLIAAAPPRSRPTNVRSCPTAAWPAPACASRSKRSWMRSPARPGIEPCEVRLRNIVGSGADAVRQHRRQALRQRRLSRMPAPRGRGDPARGRARTAEARRARRAADRRRAFLLRRAGRARHAVLAGWGRPFVPGYEQASELTPDGEVEIRVGTHSHGQGHETTSPRSRTRFSASTSTGSKSSRATRSIARIRPAPGARVRCAWRRRGGRRLARAGGTGGAYRCLADAGRCRRVRVANGRVVAGNSSISLREVARAWYLQPQTLPPDVDPGGLEVTAGYRAARDSGTFSYAARGRGRRRSGDRRDRDPRLCRGRRRRHAGQSDDRRRPNSRRHRPGHRHCLYEAMPFDAQGQPLATTLRIICCRARPKCRTSACCTCRRRRRTRSSASKGSAKAARSVRRPPSFGRQRRAAAARRRGARFAADARAHSRRDRQRAGANSNPRQTSAQQAKSLSRLGEDFARPQRAARRR